MADHYFSMSNTMIRNPFEQRKTMSQTLLVGILSCTYSWLAPIIVSICLIMVSGRADAEVPKTAKQSVEPSSSPTTVEITYSEDREPCRNRDPLRNVYFGDLHVHTAYSFDAYGNGMRTKPNDAYRYARGRPIALPPYDEQGNPIKTVRIDRPLDFMAVTDHAEYFGEMAVCLDPNEPNYKAKMCSDLRKPGYESYVPMAPTIVLPNPQRMTEICDQDGQTCERRIPTVWKAIQEAAENAYDRSPDCSFTTFVGYEYSGVPRYRNLHRNVIFRNHKVPDKPISYVEAPKDFQLWEQLQSACVENIEGCDVLAIPHNSNLSNGALLAGVKGNSLEEQRKRAAMRHATEPLMEIFQHKGNSECMNGLTGVLGEPDELCEMEQVRKLGTYSSYKNIFAEVIDCEGEPGFFGLFNGGCVAYNDFFRGAALLGLKEEQRLGINPLKMGVIGSTDTHVGAAGGTDEKSWGGHIAYETSLEGRLGAGYLPSNLNGNPGGLAGVWAIENSRDAIFDALKRRETFGTSGTRIIPRFFGGWHYPDDLCDKPQMIEQAYELGVPMGGNLPALPNRAVSPTFIAAALRDPSKNGNALQKLQIIKGWIDSNGEAHQRVYDVAGDTNTRPFQKSTGAGFPYLCTVFSDPDFESTLPAFYYLRAVDQPSLRWSTAQCRALSADKRPAACDNDAPEIIHELAWTSSIWYRPDQRALN